jgi:hypothetical protein
MGNGANRVWRDIFCNSATETGRTDNPWRCQWAFNCGNHRDLKLLVQKPESYLYFYDGKLLTEDDPNRVFILYMAEIFANYMENVINQAENKSAEDAKTWTRFIVDTCEMAPVVRKLLLERKEGYLPELVRIAEDVQTRGESIHA